MPTNTGDAAVAIDVRRHGTSILPQIDGLRGVAILAVIYQHAFSHGIGDWLGSHGVFPYLQGNGWLGVSLFFILSGFVLARGFIAAGSRPPDAADAVNFYLRRAKRLLPLFAIGCFVGYLINRTGPKSLLLALSTFSMFDPGEFQPRVNGQFWTLTLEIWFSMLVPVLLILAWRFGYWRLLAGAVAIALVSRLAATKLTFPGLTIDPVKDSVPARIDDFVIGIVLAKLYVDGRLRELPRWLPWLGIALVLASALAWDMVLQHMLPAPVRAFLNLPTAAGFACIVASSLAKGAGLLTVWPLRVAGAMCYSLYCWHYWIMQATDPNSLLLRPIMLFLLIAIGISLLSYRFIEFPQRSWRYLLRWQDGGHHVRRAVPPSTGQTR